ncbi:LysR family transcriptional regulator [Haloferula sp. A504]|uniref:LysR family transcriptional regulator n=1 Tax=Haloferula sp. A504 TaxID=3373601 RepID=UPI0031BDBB10|nr:LysR family transcriptional regulator [Verrucomicrobiaceae bacterium E54]
MRSFLAVAEEGSITAATGRTHLSASAISRQIKALEEELGVVLLERSAHSIELTPAGEVLARDGAAWVATAGRIAERVREVAKGELIRVAYAPSLAGPMLGPALECFAQLHPGVRVQLFDASTTEMKCGLRSGSYDLIVTVPGSGDESAIEWRPLMRLPWRVATPAASGKTGPLQLAELNGARLLIYQRDEYPDYWRLVSELLRDSGAKPVVVGEFDGWTSLRTAVEGGLGLALVAGHDDAGDRILLRKIEPQPEPVCVSVGCRRESPPGPACLVLIEEMARAARQRG